MGTLCRLLTVMDGLSKRMDGLATRIESIESQIIDQPTQHPVPAVSSVGHSPPDPRESGRSPPLAPSALTPVEVVPPEAAKPVFRKRIPLAEERMMPVMESSGGPAFTNVVQVIAESPATDSSPCLTTRLSEVSLHRAGSLVQASYPAGMGNEPHPRGWDPLQRRQSLKIQGTTMYQVPIDDAESLHLLQVHQQSNLTHMFLVSTNLHACYV